MLGDLMHELSATKEMISLVLKECRNRRIIKLNRITLEVGAFTTFKKEPIEYYFSELKEENELLKACILEISEIPGIILCKECGKKTILKDPSIISCSFCDSPDIEMIRGKDFLLKEIDGE
jgi:hydrogenase nickel incorporation protein HypA/HybF